MAFAVVDTGNGAFRSHMFVAATSFALGVFVGMRLEALRIRWLKWRRERLRNKLIETQKKIDSVVDKM